MSEIERPAADFIGYEYKERTVGSNRVSLLIDCYRCFGWVPDENVPSVQGNRMTTIKLKRDRKIINKTELTRLQRNFEACVNEISQLEQSKTFTASLGAVLTGIAGTAFMAGSTFAITHEPPAVWLCILLAVPGFMGWILPYFLYREIRRRKTEKAAPLIEQKQDEIYEICEKGNRLIQG